MSNLSSISYLSAAVAYLILTGLLLRNRKGRSQALALIVAALFSSFWAGLACYDATNAYTGSLSLILSEILKDLAWLVFVFMMLLKGTTDSCTQKALKNTAIIFSVGFGLIAISLLLPVLDQQVFIGKGFEIRVVLPLLLVIAGLFLVEQLFRRTTQDHKWAIKFLCLGLGGAFVYDFYLYSDALLFNRIDEEIWNARGFINLIIVPLIAISVNRNPELSTEIFVSHKFTFHSTGLIAVGLYLVSMSAGAYYIKYYGGDWGGIAQLIFLFGAVVVLLVLIFSGNIRANVRVFLSKHLYHYRYDYREEWLNLIRRMSTEQGSRELKMDVIKAIADIVECKAGILWVSKEGGVYRADRSWNMVLPDEKTVDPNESLVRFLREWQWVIDIQEYELDQDLYKGLMLPQWLGVLPKVRQVVPLIHKVNLIGFVVLADPRTNSKLNWEERDLLLTAGRQVAGYLALIEADEALVSARQFEAFNRLSAFVVHDLKNIVAQLSLIVTNAAKHKDNPAFLEDAIGTVDHATKKMSKLLTQLRKGKSADPGSSRILLAQLFQSVIKNRCSQLPIPKLKCEKDEILVIADKDRLAAVLEHIVQNAQEATPDSGYVDVHVYTEGDKAIIRVDDNGCGMDAEFIENRLFKPFETTKGNAGMGIGAYEAREFVRQLGGSIEVTSVLDKGSTFQVNIPLHRVIDAGQGPVQTNIVS